MGARSVAAFVSLSLPRTGGEQLARELYEGIFELAAEFDTAIAGGDTNSWDGPLVISITAVGEVQPQNVWRRSGARPGDQILVTGDFGGSILGKHLSFTPRLKAAAWLSSHAKIHAAIDVSDGLSLDLSRLVSESRCGAEIDLGCVPISPAAQESAKHSGQLPLEHGLGDGEDFELILAVPPEEADRLVKEQPLEVPLTRIGQFIEDVGLWALEADGSRRSLSPRGYEHRLE
jgi:thiamine-monophosphate kinase